MPSRLRRRRDPGRAAAPGVGAPRPVRPPGAAAAAVAGAMLGAWSLLNAACDAPGAGGHISASPVGFLSAGPQDQAYARVTGPLPLRFPRDHGPHPEYRTEWWYLTGNLAAADGERFGFQATFFRNAVTPERAAAERRSAWAANQVYLAHFAVTDVEGAAFASDERLERGALGLAGAVAEPFAVWVGGWSVERSGPEGSAFRLRASTAATAADLTLRPAKPLVLHGRDGYSPKGPQAGNASMYVSYTRLEATGTLTTARRAARVAGLAWMDHEWSTSALDAGSQTGWDWFSLQLDDGVDLMLFQIREAGGGVAQVSSGTLVDPAGGTRHIERHEFAVVPRGAWRSPRTGAEYPAGWRLTVSGRGLDVDLEVEPLLADQELSTFIRYWEGAVRVTGRAGGRPVTGHGYVELTGYAPEAAGPGRR